MTSKEALDKIRFAVSISQDLPYKECNDLCDIIQQDLERLEEIDKAQEVEFNNLKFTENENKYQTSIRVLKEAFIALGKSDIANTCWFKYLEQLEKENQKYMQLSNELGCPLEVVFKAIEDGIVIIGDLKENGGMTLWLDEKPLIALIGEKRNFEEPRLIKYNEWCFTCESGSYSGCVSLKDYKKTWWLVSDKEKEE